MMMMRLFDGLGFVQLVKQSQDDGADDVVEWRVSPTAERLQAASASAQLSSDEGAFLCPISVNVNHSGGAIHKILSKEFEQARTPSKKKVCLFFSVSLLFVICSPVCCLFPNPINPFRCMRRSGYIWKEISLSACLVLSEIPRHGREARAMAVVIFFFSGCTIAKGRSSSSE